jgi:hypothetical protein
MVPAGRYNRPRALSFSACAYTTTAATRALHRTGISLPWRDETGSHIRLRDPFIGKTTAAAAAMINAVLVFNNSGQPRLTKFYTQLVRSRGALGTDKDRLLIRIASRTRPCSSV